MTSRCVLVPPPALARSAAVQDNWPSPSSGVPLDYTPGGVTDIASRAFCERMLRARGRTRVLKTQLGAATMVANTAVG